MYLRMNVGAYKGEIRGPFHIEVAKALIARGDAVRAESIGDGKYAVLEEKNDAQPADDDQPVSKIRRKFSK